MAGVAGRGLPTTMRSAYPFVSMTSPGSPTVSVIVPCYRVTAFISQTLDSLRAQTFRDFETIVVNDGCPETEALERTLAPYRDEIVYIKQENRGLAGARNTGIKAGRAPFVAFLDGDDVWKPDYLAVQVGHLEKHPDVAVVYPNAVIIGETTWAGRLFRDIFPSRGEVTLSSLLTGECRVNISIIAQREALMAVNLFDPSLRSGEDYDLWLRMAKAGYRFLHHDRVLYEYRVRRGTLSGDKISLPQSAIRILNKLLGRADLTCEERRLARKALAEYHTLLSLTLGKTALYRDERQEALLHLRQANQVLKNRKIQAALVLLRLAPRLLNRLLRRRYRTEYEFLH